MHRADVVVVGPIAPLLPRALRMPIPVAFAGGQLVADRSWKTRRLTYSRFDPVGRVPVGRVPVTDMPPHQDSSVLRGTAGRTPDDEASSHRQTRSGPVRCMTRSPTHILPRTTTGATPDSRREQILRYLLKHPEYHEPQTNGELTFFMAQQTSTGRSVVTVRFNAHPEVFP
jgi:hypothetical protein